VVRTTPLALALIVTGVEVVAALVVTVNVALVAPAGTETLAGTDAAALLLDNATAKPPDGAAAVKVTVPVEGLPPTTLEGLTETADRAGAVCAAWGVNRRTVENGPAPPA
jgi:hypothetical protein